MLKFNNVMECNSLRVRTGFQNDPFSNDTSQIIFKIQFSKIKIGYRELFGIFIIDK